jgi:hypothetical protein
MLSFFHKAEEAASVVERSAVGVIMSAVSGTEATQGWTWPPLGFEPFVRGGDLVGAANRSPVAGLPEEYPDGSTCWRRLRMWEERGIWLAAWRKLLSLLDQRRLLDWEEAFLDATFITAKKGARQSGKPVAGKVRSAWWWSTAGAYLSECNLGPRRLPNAGSRRAPSNK